MFGLIFTRRGARAAHGRADGDRITPLPRRDTSGPEGREGPVPGSPRARPTAGDLAAIAPPGVNERSSTIARTTDPAGPPEAEKRVRARCGVRSLTAAGFLAVLGLAQVARAQDEDIPVDRVPEAVLDAAKATFPGARIQEASEETEGETKVYSLKLKHQRHILDVTFKDDGTLVLVETAVLMKEIPKGVLLAAAHQYPGANLRHAGAVRRGPEVKKTADYYELYLVTTTNRPRMVTVDPKGEVLQDPLQRLTKRKPVSP